MARSILLIFSIFISFGATAKTTVQLSDVSMRMAIDVLLSHTNKNYVVCPEIATFGNVSVRASFAKDEDIITWLESSGLTVLGKNPIRICTPSAKSVVYRPQYVPVSFLRSSLTDIPQAMSSDTGQSQKGNGDSSVFVGSCKVDDCDKLLTTLKALDQPLKRGQLKVDLYQVTLSDEKLRELTTTDVSPGLFSDLGGVFTFKGVTLRLTDLESFGKRLFSQLIQLQDATLFSSRFGQDVSYQETSISNGVLTTSTEFLKTGTELRIVPRFLSDGLHLTVNFLDSTPTRSSGSLTVSSSSAATDVLLSKSKPLVLLEVQDSLSGNDSKSIFSLPFSKAKRRSETTLVLVGEYI